MDQAPVIKQQKVLDPKSAPLRRMLATIFLTGLFVAVVLAVNIAIENYHSWMQRRLMAKIEPTTLWVKEEIPLYLISHNKIIKVNLSGLGFKEVYKADDSIREYSFSPDGKYLLVNTVYKLTLVDLLSGRSKLVESLVLDSPGLKGALSRVTWDRESQKIFYMESLWSSVSSHEAYFIYDIARQKKTPLPNLSSRVMDVYWDWEGKNLYYTRLMQKDRYDPYKFSLKIFRLPMTTLKPQAVETLSTDQKLAAIDLSSFKIKLFVPRVPLTFEKKEVYNLSAVSAQGMEIRFSQNGSLYYGKEGSHLREIMRLPRFPGESPLTCLEWASGERYVLLVHRSLGILVFDPVTRRIGRLTDLKAQGLGWNPTGRDPAKTMFSVKNN